MHAYRRLGAGLGFALLLSTAASTTYAQSSQQVVQSGDNSFNWCTTWFAPLLPWCNPDPDPKPVPGPPLTATPELDSLVLFGVGLSGIGGYAVTRLRARRRQERKTRLPG